MYKVHVHTICCVFEKTDHPGFEHCCYLGTKTSTEVRNSCIGLGWSRQPWIKTTARAGGALVFRPRPSVQDVTCHQDLQRFAARRTRRAGVCNRHSCSDRKARVRRIHSQRVEAGNERVPCKNGPGVWKSEIIKPECSLLLIFPMLQRSRLSAVFSAIIFSWYEMQLYKNLTASVCILRVWIKSRVSMVCVCCWSV